MRLASLGTIGTAALLASALSPAGTAPASAAGSQVAWISVRDPYESAFSVDVPKGWKTRGGMIRFGPVDARPYVDMTSPDGHTNIRLGDATIAPYSTPNRWVRGADPGPFVAPYASGDEFAAKYGAARFGSLCGPATLVRGNALEPKYHKAGSGPYRVTAGQAIFTCHQNGHAMAGYVYAETLFVGSPYGPSDKWFVVALGSFLAPVAQAKAAGAMLKHAGESIAFNPEWAKGQQARINAATGVLLGVAKSNWDSIAATNARQAKWRADMAHQSDTMQDVLLGQSYTRDPQTGQNDVVPTGLGGGHWMDGRGDVVNSELSPGPAFHKLDTISRWDQ
jgi:uncharacterized protein YfiM (DUF2279 family)